MRTPFARHAGSDSLSRHVLGDAADGIDVQPENVGHLHSRRQLGIDQLGDHQAPRGVIVRRPIEQRDRSQKDGVTPTLGFPKQAQPATEENARRRRVVQPRLLIERGPGG